MQRLAIPSDYVLQFILGRASYVLHGRTNFAQVIQQMIPKLAQRNTTHMPSKGAGSRQSNETRPRARCSVFGVKNAWRGLQGPC